MVVKSLKCLYRSSVPCYVIGWYLIFDVVTLTDILVTWSWHVYTWYLYTPDTCHAILNTWYLTPALAMLYLTLDIRHRYWICYHTLDMLSPSTSKLALILWHLTGYCYIWHLYYIAYSWLSLLRRLGMIIILLQDFWYSWIPVLQKSCTPELLYSWTPITGRLLILYSCLSP